MSWYLFPPYLSVLLLGCWLAMLWLTSSAWGAFGLEGSVGQVSAWRLSSHSPGSFFLKEMHSNMRTVSALLCWTWSSAMYSEKESTKCGRFFSRTLIKHWFVPDFPLTLAAFPALSTHSRCLESQCICYYNLCCSTSLKGSFPASTSSAENPKLYRL